MKDVRVRYKQTVFGAVWAVIQPLGLMLIFTLFLGRIVAVPSGGVPYPVFVYAGLVPWTLFARALTGASDSLVANTTLVTKVYFPRLLLTIAPGVSYVLDFAVASFVLVAIMLVQGIDPGWGLFAVPVVVITVLVVSTAFGSLFASANVLYRDVPHAIPFLIQAWLFATPIAYPMTMVPERWRWAVALNPMTGVVDGFRSAVLGTPLDGRTVLLSSLTASVALVIGVAYFRRTERAFADWI